MHTSTDVTPDSFTTVSFTAGRPSAGRISKLRNVRLSSALRFEKDTVPAVFPLSKLGRGLLFAQIFTHWAKILTWYLTCRATESH